MDFNLHATVYKHIHIVCICTSISNEVEDTLDTRQHTQEKGQLVQNQQCSSSTMLDSGVNIDGSDLADGHPLTSDTATASGVTENLEIYLKTTSSDESRSAQMKAVKRK